MYNAGQTQVVFSSPTRLFTPIITAIIVLMIAGFALIHYAAGFTVGNLALAAQSVLRGKIWELVTYSLVNGSPGNLIFNGLVVLFMGSAIEREWGARSLIVLWLVVAVVCGIIWMAVSLLSEHGFVGIGTEACVYGIIATFGMLYRGTRMWFYFFTVEAQYLALIVIGIGVVMSIVQPLSLIWVSGALVAYMYVKLRWRAASRHGGIPAAGSGRSNGFVDID